MQTRPRLLSRYLFRYVLGEYLISFVGAFLLFFVIFLINQMIVITRDVLSRQVDIGKAMLLLVYSLPAVLVITFPFGSLVGAMLTIGRLSADNEMIAVQAVGYGLRQIFLPVLSGSVALSLLAFMIGNILLPMGTIQYRRLLEELIYSNTELVLKPYSVTRFNQTAIVTDDVRAGTLASILLFDASETGRKRIITARGASLDKTLKDTGVLKLQLDEVTMVEFSGAYNDADRSDLLTMAYTLAIKDLTQDVRNPLPSEMSFLDIRRRIGELREELQARQGEGQLRARMEEQRFIQALSRSLYRNEPGLDELTALAATSRRLATVVVVDKNLQNHWIEFWKKLTIPFACTALVVLAFPLGLFARRNARTLGLGIALVIAGFFWGSIILGQYLSIQYLDLDAGLIMWAPNIIFIIAGGLAFIPLVRR